MGKARLARSVTLLALGAAWIATATAAWGRVDTAPDAREPAVVLRIREPRDAGGDSRYRELEGELTTLEIALFADGADGRWDEHSLLGAALIAGGVRDPEVVRQYEARVAALVDRWERSGQIGGSPRQRAQALFELMHRHLLQGGYRLECTSLAGTLDDGRFNCVSASVLFNCLAARFGLAACALEVPGHALSRLDLPDGALEVETTCPAWFRVSGDPKKRAELLERVLGVSADRSDAPGEARMVNEVEQVAMIYYNRGVDLLAENRFAEAAAANVKALRLDPASATAYGNLLATLNNWAIHLDSRGRHAEAARLLRRGIEIDPQYETFRVNYVHVHGQWIENLCRSGRYREALGLIGRAAAEGIADDYFRQARLDTYRRWARARFRVGQGARWPEP